MRTPRPPLIRRPRRPRCPVASEITKFSSVEGLQYFAAIANRAGVTTIADLLFGNMNWDAAVNRIAEDGETAVAPGECIGVERALRAVTSDAAYILGLEDKIGSLEQGKFADFVILEEDPLEVDPKHIKDIPIWGTALSGKLFEARE